MGVAIKAKFGKGRKKYNGLDSIEADLLDKPHEERYVVARIRTVRTSIDYEHGSVETPTINFEHIEVMLSEAEVKDAKRLFENACRHRLGEMPQATLFDDGKPADDEPEGAEENSQ